MEIDVNELFFWDPIVLEGTPFEINRVVVLMFVASLLCMGFFLLGSRRGSLVPKGIQNLAESAYLFVRDGIAIDVIGPKDGLKFAPYLASVFFFFFLFSADFVALEISLPLGILTALLAAVLILFELLVISIQAYIFTLLSAFYIAESIHGHGEEDHEVSTHQEPQYETEGMEAR